MRRAKYATDPKPNRIPIFEGSEGFEQRRRRDEFRNPRKSCQSSYQSCSVKVSRWRFSRVITTVSPRTKAKDDVSRSDIFRKI